MKTEQMEIFTLTQQSCASTAIQCLANSGIAEKSTAFKQQIENAKRMGLMPDDIKVIRETLSNFGFFMQSSQVEDISVIELINKLGQISNAVLFVQLVDYRFHGGNMIAMRSDGCRYKLFNSKYSSVDYVTNRLISHVWIKWDDCIDRSPFPRRTATRNKRKSSKRKQYSETSCYKPFQPNPCDNSIGDCVVRAMAGVMDISWIDAIDLLSATGETTINTKEVYPIVLEQNGFRHRQPIIRNNRQLKGDAFCNELNRLCQKGERIFAHVGRSHAAAIVPTNNNTGYKIIDSWDSSKGSIGDYWIGPPQLNDKEEPTKAENEKVFINGEIINHSVFGLGCITSISSGVLTVDFGSKGIRRMSEDWVRDNCLYDNT